MSLTIFSSLYSLFGNKLRDHGVLTLLNGIAELQVQTARTAAAIQQAMLFPSEQNMSLQLTTGWSSFRVFALLELDIGGNGLSSNGVRLLASYIRHHSCLQYLGLAQTSGVDLAAWKELFDSLKGNCALTQIILDENNLGDPGVRLLSDMLKENMSLQQVDLDRNGISDVGGNDIMGALLCRINFPLRHLGLEGNNISARLMSRIQEELKSKWFMQQEWENPFLNQENLCKRINTALTSELVCLHFEVREGKSWLIWLVWPSNTHENIFLPITGWPCLQMLHLSLAQAV